MRNLVRDAGKLALVRIRVGPSLRRSIRLLLLTLVIATVTDSATGRQGVQHFAFEPSGRALGKGSYPQLGIRASGDLFLLRVKDHALWLQSSPDGGDSFGDYVRVNDGGEVAAHAENSPQMVVRTMREFYVLWSAEEGDHPAALRLAASTDWGRTFGKSVAVDRRGTAGQSFYTLAVGPDGAVYVAWLDGRDRGKGVSGTSALYLAKSTNRGQSFGESVRVALNVCPCCRPSIAFTDAMTLHIAWRGVIDGDVRDVFAGTSHDGGITFPIQTRIAEDNWQINGCPHSGPSIATLRGKVVTAWRTVAGGRARVYVASSADGGAHFSSKTQVDGNLFDANHPQLLALDGSVGLVFQARESRDAGWSRFDAYFREISGDGAISPTQRLRHASGSVTYPTLSYERPDHLFVVWTEGTEDGPQVGIARGRVGLRKPIDQPRDLKRGITRPFNEKDQGGEHDHD